MKGRPVAFSEAEVLAVLAGRKTQMRRALEPQPPSEEATRKAGADYGLGPMVARSVGAYSLNDYDQLPKEPGAFDVSGSVGFVRDACGQTEWTCPLGVPGDRLWVQERWALEDIEGDQRVIWHADLEAAWRSRLTETYKLGFKHEWQRVHGRDAWKANPWVWVIDFTVVS
jgi:hypothetical protein